MMAVEDRDWIGQVIHSARESFEGIFDTRTVRLLLLACLAFAVAFLAGTKQPLTSARLGGNSIGNIVAGSFFALGFVLIALTIASGLLTLRRSELDSADGASPDPSAAPGPSTVLGGQLVLGIEISRNVVIYGAVALKQIGNHGDDAPPLATVRMEELVGTRTRTLEISDGSGAMYEGLAAIVLELLTHLEQQLGQQITAGGIAITTPSAIDIRSKTLVSTVGPLPVNERVADGLARCLYDRHRTRMQQYFGTPESPVLSEQDLAEKIYLDVDARSIARFDLHHRSQNHGGWRNYACVIVLEGVGAGLILNGELYYGSHSSEGEIGHTTVHLGPELVGPGPRAQPVEIVACDCRLPGLHWESLSSALGPARLAAACDKELFDRLAAAYGHPPTSQNLVRLAEMCRGGEPSADTPREIQRMATEDPRLGDYLDTVLQEYARILTIGIANLVNVLDLDHVVIGGPFVRDLDRLGFRNEIWNCWNSYVLRGQNAGYSFETFGKGWQGATLLFWDPAYRRNFVLP